MFSILYQRHGHSRKKPQNTIGQHKAENHEGQEEGSYLMEENNSRTVGYSTVPLWGLEPGWQTICMTDQPGMVFLHFFEVVFKKKQQNM